MCYCGSIGIRLSGFVRAMVSKSCISHIFLSKSDQFCFCDFLITSPWALLNSLFFFDGLCVFLREMNNECTHGPYALEVIPTLGLAISLDSGNWTPASLSPRWGIGELRNLAEDVHFPCQKEHVTMTAAWISLFIRCIHARQEFWVCKIPCCDGMPSVILDYREI